MYAYREYEYVYISLVNLIDWGIGDNLLNLQQSIATI